MIMELEGFDNEYKPTDVVRASIHIRDGEVGITDTILTALACDIIEGRISPGETINSVEVARRFRASRTPVREAFVRLEAAGLITIPARQRPSIWKPTLKNVYDIYQVRAHLQKLVSELVIECATSRELDKLEYWQERRERAVDAGDVRSYFWDNVVGQLLEVRLTGNEELGKVITGLGLRALLLRHMSLALPGRMAQSSRLHRELLTLYRHRDQRKASEIATHIVMEGYRAIEASRVVQAAS